MRILFAAALLVLVVAFDPTAHLVTHNVDIVGGTHVDDYYVFDQALTLKDATMLINGGRFAHYEVVNSTDASHGVSLTWTFLTPSRIMRGGEYGMVVTWVDPSGEEGTTSHSVTGADVLDSPRAPWNASTFITDATLTGNRNNTFSISIDFPHHELHVAKVNVYQDSTMMVQESALSETSTHSDVLVTMTNPQCLDADADLLVDVFFTDNDHSSSTTSTASYKLNASDVVDTSAWDPVKYITKTVVVKHGKHISISYDFHDIEMGYFNAYWDYGLLAIFEDYKYSLTGGDTNSLLEWEYTGSDASYSSKLTFEFFFRRRGVTGMASINETVLVDFTEDENTDTSHHLGFVPWLLALLVAGCAAFLFFKKSENYSGRALLHT